MKKQVNSLSFHKTKSDTFTINDKDRNCKGYECKIRTSTANKWIDDYTKLYKKYTDDTTGADANSVFDDIRSSVNSYGDIDLTVYLYKNQIAAIVTEGQPGSSEYKVSLMAEAILFRIMSLLVMDVLYCRNMNIYQTA